MVPVLPVNPVIQEPTLVAEAAVVVPVLLEPLIHMMGLLRNTPPAVMVAMD